MCYSRDLSNMLEMYDEGIDDGLDDGCDDVEFVLDALVDMAAERKEVVRQAKLSGGVDLEDTPEQWFIDNTRYSVNYLLTCVYFFFESGSPCF